MIKYQLKGTGLIKYHLGCDYFRDAHDSLCYAPKKYTDKLILDYVKLFGQKRKPYWSPLEHNNHLKIDNSTELDEKDIKSYQSMIGSLHGAVSLGRFDNSTDAMTLSSFRSLPRQGHLQKAKQVYGYLSNFKDSTIRIRIGHPDYTGIKPNEYEWERSVYGKIREIIPVDKPKPLGKDVTLMTYVNANSYHDMITGRSLTGVLHLIKKTPFDW